MDGSQLAVFLRTMTTTWEIFHNCNPEPHKSGLLISRNDRRPGASPLKAVGVPAQPQSQPLLFILPQWISLQYFLRFFNFEYIWVQFSVAVARPRQSPNCLFMCRCSDPRFFRLLNVVLLLNNVLFYCNWSLKFTFHISSRYRHCRGTSNQHLCGCATVRFLLISSNYN